MSPSSPLATDRPAVLVIAATDSSGGAGLIRDVRVLTDHSVDALCVVTAVTAQSNARVLAVHHVPPDVIRTQISAALETRSVSAIKIGMLGTRATVDAVVDGLVSIANEIPIVLDPVLVSSSGGVLLDGEGRRALLERLIPRVSLVTPNVPEAAALLEEPVAQDEAGLIQQGRRLVERGARAVLLKGGHWSGAEATDLLIARAEVAPQAVVRIMSSRVTGSSRGTGCALASSIAAGL
ncbi:MAG TPA: hydroxymethylpyrimidine/phosphomethylpyrimidine kinase, partial [Steroidobacteraceae bacterium]|nr:hydroxymethylpyrimidine/phosphomethylpyrimidine kinase [Steroidobacteraceae bacterium]